MAQRDLRAVSEAAAAIDAAREKLADRMLNAQESGETVVDIARAAGLSRSRVHEMLREARARQQPREK